MKKELKKQFGKRIEGVSICYQCGKDLSKEKACAGGLIKGQSVIFCKKCRDVGIEILEKKCDRKDGRKNGMRMMWSLVGLKEH